MKTLYSLFAAAFLLIASSAFAQSAKSVFETAHLTKTSNGTPAVELAWKKGSENTAYYLVERSTDGANFKQVGLVFTSDEEQFSNYKFRDKGFAGAGTDLYYRVSIVSSTKELSYLPVKKVDRAASQSITQAAE